MTSGASIFVSNRLGRPALALMCLAAALGLVSLQGCHPELTPMAARVGAP